MLTGAITIARLIWPFLREVVFGRESVKSWLKKNGITLVWMLFIVLMLVVVVKLTMLLHQSSADAAKYKEDAAGWESKYKKDELLIGDQQRTIDALKPKKGLSVTPSTPAPPPPAETDHTPAILNELRRIKDAEEQ